MVIKKENLLVYFSKKISSEPECNIFIIVVSEEKKNLHSFNKMILAESVEQI